MAITPLPTPPSRDDPTNFAARGDAFLAALPAFAAETNAVAGEVDANALTAAASAASALAAEVAAESAAESAYQSANVTKWISGTTYTQGQNVWSPINYLTYRRKTNGAGTTDPSADSTNWTVLGGGDVTLAGAQTLTNKRITERSTTTTSFISPYVWNSDNYDQYNASSQSTALTINADSGTPTNGQKIIFRIKDSGTARALTWTTGVSKGFRAVGVTLPTTTIINKTVYIGCVYNGTDSRWDVVAVAQEA